MDKSIFVFVFLFVSISCPLSAQKVYVVDQHHPRCTDSGVGRDNRPFKTINAAAQLAKAGDTVFVKRGIYRERVSPAHGGTEGKPVVFMGEEHQAIIKGSELLTSNWTRNNNESFYSTTLNPDLFLKFNPFLIRATGIEGDRSLGQVFVNGKMYAQVSGVKALERNKGTWMIHENGRILSIHFEKILADPKEVQVEITVRDRIFAPHKRGLGYIVVKGFVMEHCANQFPNDFWSKDRKKANPQAGALSTRSGHHWSIEDNIIRFANTIGIDCGVEGGYDIEGDQEEPEYFGHHIIKNNNISYNGLCGIAGFKTPEVQILENTLNYNNFLGWTAPEAGGIKLHYFTDGLVKGNVLKNNDAHGIWLDNACINSRVSQNVVVGSRGSGIFIEMADGPCLVDNNIVAYTHAGDGIYTHDASGVTVAHNLLYANEHFGVLMRTVTDRTTFNLKGDKVLVGTHGQTVINNIFIDNYRGQLSFPYPSGKRNINNRSDYNLFITGSTWRWKGLINNPFLVNTDTREGTSKTDIAKAFMEHYRDLNIPLDSLAFAQLFKKQPLLEFEWWQKFTGNDTNSFAPAMATSALKNGAVARGSLSFSVGELYFEIKDFSPFNQLFVSKIDDVDYDFYGKGFKKDKVFPGPFQEYEEGYNRFILNGGPRVTQSD